MIDTTSLGIFLGASLALLIAPGPAVLYIVARSIDQGRMAGVVSVLGIGAGGMVHVALAVLSLSGLLVVSAMAFTVVKYLGAVYLIYLGISTLLRKTKTPDDPVFVKKPLGKIFRQGVIVNMLNPKTAIFFFAFLPQFINPEIGSVSVQIAVLGMLFISMAIVTDGAYAMVAGTLGDWLRDNEAFLKVQKYLSGSIYIVLGVATAISGSDKS